MADVTENEVKRDEEEIVSDNDADTRDVEDSVKEEKSDFSRMYEFMEEMRTRMDGMAAEIRSIKDAQSITIDNGAVIRDFSEQVDEDDIPDTRSIAELDLTL